MSRAIEAVAKTRELSAPTVDGSALTTVQPGGGITVASIDSNGFLNRSLCFGAICRQRWYSVSKTLWYSCHGR